MAWGASGLLTEQQRPLAGGARSPSVTPGWSKRIRYSSLGRRSPAYDSHPMAASAGRKCRSFTELSVNTNGLSFPVGHSKLVTDSALLSQPELVDITAYCTVLRVHKSTVLQLDRTAVETFIHSGPHCYFVAHFKPELLLWHTLRLSERFF